MMRPIIFALLCLSAPFNALPAKAQSIDCLRSYPEAKAAADFLWPRSKEIRDLVVHQQEIVVAVAADACEVIKGGGSLEEVVALIPLFEADAQTAVRLIVISDLFKLEDPALLVAALQIRYGRAATQPIMLPPPAPPGPPNRSSVAKRHDGRQRTAKKN